MRSKIVYKNKGVDCEDLYESKTTMNLIYEHKTGKYSKVREYGKSLVHKLD